MTLCVLCAFVFTFLQGLVVHTMLLDMIRDGKVGDAADEVLGRNGNVIQRDLPHCQDKEAWTETLLKGLQGIPAIGAWPPFSCICRSAASAHSSEIIADRKFQQASVRRPLISA